MLEEETCEHEEAEKAKTNLANGQGQGRCYGRVLSLSTLLQRMRCLLCLKQVGDIYPNLDLSQIVIDDTVPPTPRGDNAASNKTVNSVHTVK